MITCQPSRAKVAPWKAEPYRLWSLQDMLKPWAFHFGEYLSCILGRENFLAGLDPSTQIAAKDQFYISRLLGIGRVHCEELGLDEGGQLQRLFVSWMPRY